VQNIMIVRFANGLFEPVWNRRYVDHVQIMVAETVGVEDRGNYYDKAGVVRDMVQNHMFQLMALVAMEPPTSVPWRCRTRRAGQGAQGHPHLEAGGRAGASGAGTVWTGRGGRTGRCPAIAASPR
jgi:hypothetical protein